MNKTLKGIISGTVLLAALGGVLVFLNKTEPAEEEESSSSAGVDETPLWHAHADDINRIVVEKKDGTSFAAKRRIDKTKTTDLDGNEVTEDIRTIFSRAMRICR